MGHLTLEAVTVRLHLVEVEAQESATPKTFVTARRVGKWHPGDDAHVKTRAHTEEQPFQGPVDDADAIAIARAEHEVGLLGSSQESGDVIWIMGEISIHFENELVFALQ